ncbi:MAG: hypothetical protein AAF748_08780 [Pseudomonadota bacterium]
MVPARDIDLGRDTDPAPTIDPARDKAGSPASAAVLSQGPDRREEYGLSAEPLPFV